MKSEWDKDEVREAIAEAISNPRVGGSRAGEILAPTMVLIDPEAGTTSEFYPADGAYGWITRPSAPSQTW